MSTTYLDTFAYSVAASCCQAIFGLHVPTQQLSESVTMRYLWATVVG